MIERARGRRLEHDVRVAALQLGEAELARQTELVPIAVGARLVGHRQDEVHRRLRTRDAIAADVELVGLGIAAEDRLVVEKQAGAVWAQLLECVHGAQAAEPAADHDEVVLLAGVDDTRELARKDLVADAA